jgi:hypothetical protein
MRRGLKSYAPFLCPQSGGHQKKKRRSISGDGAFILGVDRLHRGTRNRLLYKPADRPHDPGDAADLSIMGYFSLAGQTLSPKKIAHNRSKINTILGQRGAICDVG